MTQLQSSDKSNSDEGEMIPAGKQRFDSPLDDAQERRALYIVLDSYR